MWDLLGKTKPSQADLDRAKSQEVGLMRKLAIVLAALLVVAIIIAVIAVIVWGGKEETLSWPCYLEVGQSIQTSDKLVTVTSAARTHSYDRVGDNGTHTETASAGKVFIIIDVEVQNVGSATFSARRFDFSLSDSAAFPYYAGVYAANDGFSYAQLYSAQRVRGKILFEVPEEASDLEVAYDFSYGWEEPKLAIWQLQ